MKQKLAKAIRVVTVPPVFAGLLCVILYARTEGAFSSPGHFLAAVFFLGVLPVLSYPVCAAVPALREKGRKAERNMGLIFSVAGYVCGAAFCRLTGGTAMERLIYGTYLVSGLGLAICTLAHFRASAHACGCSGPIMLLAVYVSPWFLLGYILLGAVMWASRSLDRHSPGQLIGGSAVPVLAMGLCILWAA